jgi:hypothetical protein
LAPAFKHAQSRDVVFLQHDAEKLQSGGRKLAVGDDRPGLITYIFNINEAPQKSNNSGANKTGTEQLRSGPSLGS